VKKYSILDPHLIEIHSLFNRLFSYLRPNASKNFNTIHPQVFRVISSEKETENV